MSISKPLDMNTVDPPIWRLIVGEKVYGPFTLGQIQVFIMDGRVNVRSKIAEGDGARILTAGEYPQFKSAFEERAERAKPKKLCNFVIVAQLESSREPFIEILNELGSFGEAMPGVFLLRSSIRLAEIHTRLSDIIHQDEKIMIVNATSDRLAWLGLGSEANTHMNAIWNKAA